VAAYEGGVLDAGAPGAADAFEAHEAIDGEPHQDFHEK
jgi:hypothetical protein